MTLKIILILLSPIVVTLWLPGGSDWLVKVLHG